LLEKKHYRQGHSTANKASTLQTIEKTVLCQNVACKMAKQPRVENNNKVAAYVFETKSTADKAAALQTRPQHCKQ
jgi:hypothetical protein